MATDPKVRSRHVLPARAGVYDSNLGPSSTFRPSGQFRSADQRTNERRNYLVTDLDIQYAFPQSEGSYTYPRGGFAGLPEMVGSVAQEMP
jgi:hypothetical protein